MLQVSAFQVAYRLLPGAAPWQPFGPLDPVALRMEAWKIQIAVRGDPLVPYGLQQENMLMLMLHQAKEKLQLRTVYFFRPAQVWALICYCMPWQAACEPLEGCSKSCRCVQCNASALHRCGASVRHCLFWRCCHHCIKLCLLGATLCSMLGMSADACAWAVACQLLLLLRQAAHVGAWLTQANFVLCRHRSATKSLA